MKTKGAASGKQIFQELFYGSGYFATENNKPSAKGTRQRYQGEFPGMFQAAYQIVNDPSFLETMPQLVAAQVSKMQKCQRENNEEQRVGLFPYTANYYSQYIDKRDDTWHLGSNYLLILRGMICVDEGQKFTTVSSTNTCITLHPGPMKPPGCCKTIKGNNRILGKGETPEQANENMFQERWKDNELWETILQREQQVQKINMFASHINGEYRFHYAGLTHYLNGGQSTSLEDAAKEGDNMAHQTYDDGLLRLVWDSELLLYRQMTKGPLRKKVTGGPDTDVAGAAIDAIAFDALIMEWSIRIPVYPSDRTPEEKKSKE